MRVIIGADHRGFDLKEHLKQWLVNQGYQVSDAGSIELTPEDDYPVISFAVADQLKNAQEETRGVVVCGSGVGVAVAANRVAGIRCALGFSVKQITAARGEDDVNMLSLPAEYLTGSQAEEVVHAFLVTPFQQKERYLRRIAQIETHK